MTTTIKVQVNGRYKATVKQTNADGSVTDPVEVHGNYERSPNPSGEVSFHLRHPATGTFEITEEPISGAVPKTSSGGAGGITYTTDNNAPSGEINANKSKSPR